MKLRLIVAVWLVAAGLLMAVAAHAAPSTCNVTGVVYDGAGNAVPNATIYFNSLNTQVVNGNSVAPITKAATTDANGNISTIALIQGLFIQITVCQAQGGGCGAATTGFVPLNTTVTFANLLAGTATFSGSTLTGNLNASGFRIFNVGANTTANDALSQGQSSLNNLAAPSGNYAMGGFKLTGLPAGTGSGDTMAFGLNHLNDLVTATGNYAMGTHKLTGLAAGTTSGDSIAFGLNDLSQLATATGNYAMGTNKITGLAAPGATGDALSEGHAIGGTTPAAGTFTTLVANTSLSTGAGASLTISGALHENPQLFSESSGGTITPALGGGPDVVLQITDNGNWTLANPSSSAFLDVIHWWIRIYNTSGGAGGTITLGANYRVDTSWSSTGPANGKTRVCPVLSISSGVAYIGPCTGDETN